MTLRLAAGAWGREGATSEDEAPRPPVATG